jgi:hypothetical protein
MNNLVGIWRHICYNDSDNKNLVTKKQQNRDYLILKQYQENIERQSNINAYRKKILEEANAILSKIDDCDKEPDKPIIECEIEDNTTFTPLNI